MEKSVMILVTRQQWGSRSTVVPVVRDALPEVFVHHVAGRWPTSVADEEAHMRELQTYAVETKGYQDTDYNVLIGPSGRCYEARGYFGKAAATLDRNATSRAVCLMGDTDKREPSQAQLDALPLLLADMVAKGSLMSRVTVFGHFENPAHPGATACPGRYMKPHLPAVRSRLDALLHPTIPPPPQENDDVRYLNVTAPNRGGALVAIDGSGIWMRGYVSPADRDAIGRGLNAEAVTISDAQFDDWAQAATS